MNLPWQKVHCGWLFDHDGVANLPDPLRVFLIALVTCGVDAWGCGPLGSASLRNRLLGDDAVARVEELAAVLPDVIVTYELRGSRYFVVRPVFASAAADARPPLRSNCPVPPDGTTVSRARSGAASSPRRSKKTTRPVDQSQEPQPPRQLIEDLRRDVAAGRRSPDDPDVRRYTL